MSYEVELDRYIHDLLREAGIEEESTSIDLASKSQTGGIGFPDHFAVVKNFVLVMENKSDITKLLQMDSNAGGGGTFHRLLMQRKILQSTERFGMHKKF